MNEKFLDYLKGVSQNAVWDGIKLVLLVALPALARIMYGRLRREPSPRAITVWTDDPFQRLRHRLRGYFIAGGWLGGLVLLMLVLVTQPTTFNAAACFGLMTELNFAFLFCLVEPSYMGAEGWNRWTSLSRRQRVAWYLLFAFGGTGLMILTFYVFMPFVERHVPIPANGA